MIFFNGILWITQLTYVVSQGMRRFGGVCPHPPEFLFGTLTPGDRWVGSVRIYSCGSDYQAMGDPTIRCQNDLTWTQLQLNCLACPDPETESGCGRVTQGSNTLRSTREYRCDSGFEPLEPITITCLPGPEGPAWSKPTHKCRGCASTPFSRNSQHGPPVVARQPEPVVAYLCETGLIEIGNGKVTCIDGNGFPIWSKPAGGCPETRKLRASRARVDYCKSNPCLNGGKCTSMRTGFKCTCTGENVGATCEGLPADCTQILSGGAGKVTGLYNVYPKGSEKFQVVCDMETDGGGWTVIQSRRDTKSSNFSKPWKDYEQGFGTLDPSGSFWLGLEKIYQITKGGGYELRIDMEGTDGRKSAAIYQNFAVGDNSTWYKLKIGTYKYDRSAGLSDPGDSLTDHNGSMFTTSDVPNAGFSSGGTFINCGDPYKGGWWYIKNRCIHADLNGKTAVWRLSGLSKTKMMIRKT